MVNENGILNLFYVMEGCKRTIQGFNMHNVDEKYNDGNICVT